MENGRGSLVVSCEDRSLRALLRGAAADSQLEFSLVCSMEEARHLFSASAPAILVMVVDAINSEHLAVVRETQSAYAVPVILVTGRLDNDDTARAICAGAIACLDYQNAMRTLVYLVVNLAKNMLSGFTGSTRKVLLISDRVTLRTADDCVSDGQHKVQLPPIPAALLRCLASRPNEVISFGELIREAWGCAEGASITALHQQMYQLRERLSEFSIRGNLASVRGRGYILRIPDLVGRERGIVP